MRVLVTVSGLPHEYNLAKKAAKIVSKELDNLDIYSEVVELRKVEKLSLILKYIESFDLVYIISYGGIGENGVLQSILESYNIPYTGCSSTVSTVCRDKYFFSKLAKIINITTPKTFKVDGLMSIDNIEKLIIGNQMKFPLVVKPRFLSGSSIGVQIIKTKEELQQFDLENYNIEEYINGREISIGVIGEKILQPIEIVIEGGFYDYEKKYTPGVVKEICPANISEELKKRLEIYAKTVHDLMGFEVYSRSDFIIDDNGEIYFIETNSIPGMTPTSLLPKEAEAEGINFSNLCKKIINLSIKKYN